MASHAPRPATTCRPPHADPDAQAGPEWRHRTADCRQQPYARSPPPALPLQATRQPDGLLPVAARHPRQLGPAICPTCVVRAPAGMVSGLLARPPCAQAAAAAFRVTRPSPALACATRRGDPAPMLSCVVAAQAAQLELGTWPRLRPLTPAPDRRPGALPHVLTAICGASCHCAPHLAAGWNPLPLGP